MVQVSYTPASSSTPPKTKSITSAAHTESDQCEKQSPLKKPEPFLEGSTLSRSLWLSTSSWGIFRNLAFGFRSRLDLWFGYRCPLCTGLSRLRLEGPPQNVGSVWVGEEWFCQYRNGFISWIYSLRSFVFLPGLDLASKATDSVALGVRKKMIK